jgi:tRNA(fMet)-specific endonuclease VapC
MAPRYILDTDICIHVRRRRLPALLEKFNSLERGEAVLSVITYGELLYGARKSSDSKRNDLWIAAQAKLADLTLVTGNEREFRRIAGLKIENWVIM